MHLSRAIVLAVVPKINFSAKQHEARSSGGITLKEGGAKRPRGYRVRVGLDTGFMAGVGFNIRIYLFYIHVATMHSVSSKK